jgi:hypothetical protein
MTEKRAETATSKFGTFSATATPVYRSNLKTPLEMQEKMENAWVLVSRNVWRLIRPLALPQLTVAAPRDPLNSAFLHGAATAVCNSLSLVDSHSIALNPTTTNPLGACPPKPSTQGSKHSPVAEVQQHGRHLVACCRRRRTVAQHADHGRNATPDAHHHHRHLRLGRLHRRRPHRHPQVRSRLLSPQVPGAQPQPAATRPQSRFKRTSRLKPNALGTPLELREGASWLLPCEAGSRQALQRGGFGVNDQRRSAAGHQGRGECAVESGADVWCRQLPHPPKRGVPSSYMYERTVASLPEGACATGRSARRDAPASRVPAGWT